MTIDELIEELKKYPKSATVQLRIWNETSIYTGIVRAIYPDHASRNVYITDKRVRHD